MHLYQIRDVLETVYQILRWRRAHTRGNHYRDKSGKALNPIAASIPRVDRSCIGGAVITSLYVNELIEAHTGRDTKEYCAVMCTLAETIGAKGTPYQKIRAVRRYNNEQTFRKIKKMVLDTIRRLPKE